MQSATGLERHAAAARLDRLPIGSFHRKIMWMMAYIFFFELGDINTFGFVAPALHLAWKLPLTTIGFVTSAQFVGMLFGALYGGWFADRVGRKRALIATTLWYSGFSLLNACAWNPASLYVARLLTGLGLSAMTVVGVAYISEMFPVKRRGAFQSWVIMIGVCGHPATALVARFVVPLGTWGWRLVFIWGALGMLALLLLKEMEESPLWYENQGRFTEADAVLQRIESKVRAEFGELPPVPGLTLPRAQRAKYSELFAPGVRSVTALLICTWVLESLGFFAVQAWVPTLLVAKGFSLVRSLTWTSLMQFGAPVGAMLAGLITDRWDRKWLIVIIVLVKALFAVLYGMSNTQTEIVVFGFLVMVFFQTFTPIIYAYTAECFPTRVRSSGAGISYGAGRGANMVGPLIVALLFTHYGYRSVFIYIAVLFSVLALITTIFGPKTKGRLLV